jgi:hypothetical protein
VTFTSASATVNFSSINQSYRDLVLVCTGTSANTSVNSIQIQFNGDTGTNYSYVLSQGVGSTASSLSGTITAMPVGLTISSSVNVNIFQIMDYSATNKHKVVLARANSMGESYIRVTAGRWANTAAITSVLCKIDTGANFSTGSTFALYGIAA